MKVLKSYTGRKYNFKKKSFKNYRAYRKTKRGWGGGQVNNHLTRARFDTFDTITSTNTSTGVTFGSLGGTSVGLFSLIQTASEFSDYSKRYQRFRITGLKIEFERTLSPSTSPFPGNVSPPMFFCVSLGGNALTGGDVFDANDNFRPLVLGTERQSKYWGFPRDAVRGANGAGVGSWTQINQVSSVPGSFFMANGNIGAAGSAVVLFNIRFMIYLDFIESL